MDGMDGVSVTSRDAKGSYLTIFASSSSMITVRGPALRRSSDMAAIACENGFVRPAGGLWNGLKNAFSRFRFESVFNGHAGTTTHQHPLRPTDESHEAQALFAAVLPAWHHSRV